MQAKRGGIYPPNSFGYLNFLSIHLQIMYATTFARIGKRKFIAIKIIACTFQPPFFVVFSPYDFILSYYLFIVKTFTK